MAEVTKGDVEDVKVVAEPVTTGEKLGGKCCGCCCDYRRAVIVMAIIGIVFNSIYLIIFATGSAVGGAYAANATDDIAMEEMAIVSGITGLYAIGYAVGVCFFVFQLFAALKYSKCMLITVLVFDVISLAFGLANAVETSLTSADMAAGIIIILVFFALEIYPTVGLLLEIQKGIMSAETYPREAYSCCCEPKV
jgi:hypothetical protein